MVFAEPQQRETGQVADSRRDGSSQIVVRQNEPHDTVGVVDPDGQFSLNVPPVSTYRIYATLEGPSASGVTATREEPDAADTDSLVVKWSAVTDGDW